MITIHAADHAEPERLSHILPHVVESIMDRAVAKSCQPCSRDHDCRPKLENPQANWQLAAMA